MIININEALPGFDRYNGGWIKTITAINKKKQNGYSLIGEFLPNNQGNIDLQENTLYLDCSIGGSRKNQTRDYHLFTIQHNGEINLIQTIEDGGKDWAVTLWDNIEKTLSQQPKSFYRHIEPDEAKELIRTLDNNSLQQIIEKSLSEYLERDNEGILNPGKKMDIHDHISLVLRYQGYTVKPMED